MWMWLIASRIRHPTYVSFDPPASLHGPHPHTFPPNDRQRHAREVWEKDMLSMKSDVLAKMNVETQRVERQIVEMEKVRVSAFRRGLGGRPSIRMAGFDI